MWNNTVLLGHSIISDETDDIGDKIEKIVYDDEIFCNEKSVKSSEFYQAQAVGLRAEIVLEVWAEEYNKEKYVKYENEEYEVLRTYRTSSEKIELTLIRGIE